MSEIQGSDVTYWPYSGLTDLGDCWATLVSGDEPGGKPVGIRIEQAGPRVLISGVLLAEFHESMQFGSLQCVGKTAGCPIGDVFTFDGLNRRVVYRVIGRDSRWLEGNLKTYVAEWPD